jgi:hypothetical protein
LGALGMCRTQKLSRLSHRKARVAAARPAGVKRNT